MTKIASFDIHYSQKLDPSGQLQGTLEELATDGVDKALLIELYRWMLLARIFDGKAIALQRTGRLGTYASCLGQEAVGAAIGKAMHVDDVFLQSYRETTTLLCRGVKIEEALMYWGGDERGMDFEVPREDMPCAIPIASQCCHGVGISYAFKLRQQPRVAVVACGDGATSKGDFHEALNAAGVWQLPLVFIVNNNQWAISQPRCSQSASETLAQKAIAGGISCEQIDGNDVVGCYLQIQQAIERAREGSGPHLIEALTYRLSDHTTADDASRYREEKSLKAAWENEPLGRLEKLLLNEKLVNQQQLDELETQCKAQVEQAVEAYLQIEPAAPESMFQYLYKDLPRQLQGQFEAVKAAGKERGDL